MKSILYIATSDIHLKTFHVPHLDWLTRNGHSVDLAYEDRAGIRFEMARHEHQITFPRSLNPILLGKAFSRLQHVIDVGDYDVLHCHTPIPSALSRLAARKWRRRGGKLLYTSHGFHFHKGAALKNWLIYYPTELLLSHFTDFIITINMEDLAYTRKPLWGAPSAKIPGIGVQPRGFCRACDDERNAIRKELGFEDRDFILLYIAEFTLTKNHRFIIESLKELSTQIPELKVVFLGEGATMNDCDRLVHRHGLQDKVVFMGFRTDVAKFARIADVGVSASKREGLGIAVLEQMMCAVPVVVSDNRGHREFVDHGKTGFAFKQNDREEFLMYVLKLYEDKRLLKSMGEQAHVKAQDFALDRSLEAMAKIYEEYL